MLNKKTKQIQEMAEEKGTQAGEIHDLKDMLEVKERKVNVLQKKVRLQRSTSDTHHCCIFIPMSAKKFQVIKFQSKPSISIWEMHDLVY